MSCYKSMVSLCVLVRLNVDMVRRFHQKIDVDPDD